MIKSAVKYILLTLSVGGLVAAVFVGGANVSGYCWQKGRRLTELELFRGAIEASNLGARRCDLRCVEKLVGRPISSLVPYDTVYHFLTENPDCCTFYSTGQNLVPPATGLWSDIPLHYMIFGWAWTAIAVKARMKYVDSRGVGGELLDESVYWLDACGVGVRIPSEYWIG